MAFLPLPSGTVIAYAGRNAPSGWLFCDGSEVSKTVYPELFLALLDSNGTAGIYDTQVNPTTGSAWAAPVAGNFRLPDFRGLFLRGTGTASGGDATVIGAQQTQKTAKNGLSNANSSLSALTLVSSSVSGSLSSLTLNASSVSGYLNASGVGGVVGGQDGRHIHTAFTDGKKQDAGSPLGPKGGDYGYPNVVASVSVSQDNSGHGHGFTLGLASSAVTGTAAAQGLASSAVTGTATAQGLASSVVVAPTISGDNETRPINKGINYIIKL